MRHLRFRLPAVIAIEEDDAVHVVRRLHRCEPLRLVVGADAVSADMVQALTVRTAIEQDDDLGLSFIPDSEPLTFVVEEPVFLRVGFTASSAHWHRRANASTRRACDASAQQCRTDSRARGRTRAAASSRPSVSSADHRTGRACSRLPLRFGVGLGGRREGGKMVRYVVQHNRRRRKTCESLGLRPHKFHALAQCPLQP
jgi:hypothetical protein